MRITALGPWHTVVPNKKLNQHRTPPNPFKDTPPPQQEGSVPAPGEMFSWPD